MFTATAGPHGERGGDTTTGDDGVTVHRLAIRLPGGIPVNPFAPPEVRRRLDGRGLRRRPRAPRRGEPVRHRPGAGGARRRAAGDRHLPLRHRPLGRRVPGAGPPRPLGRARRRAQRGVERWRRRGCPSAARGAVVEVVPNGVDAAWWRPAVDRARARRATRHPVHVVSAMRLVSRKRPLATLAVLRGARAVLDPAVPLRATIVGEGPQRRLMERYLRTRRMDWVELARAGRQGGAAPAAPGRRRLPDHRPARGLRHRPARGAGGRGAGRRAARHRRRRLRGRRGRRPARRQRRRARPGALAHLAGDDALRARMRAHLLGHPAGAGLERGARRHPGRVPAGRGGRA